MDEEDKEPEKGRKEEGEKVRDGNEKEAKEKRKLKRWMNKKKNQQKNSMKRRV